ncbi:MAG: DegQ family serine endoprotease [Alphaproteobacteria bacterium]|nr:DegQ family serine endoprotease [Alphaproteobacteria bacterium]MBV9692844.1 DegQ family serine endoprotease [Alphaproteobacteria bacterium]
MPFRFLPGVHAVLAMLALLAAPLAAAARPAPESFADLTDKLLPTVVNIASSQTLKPSQPQAALPQVPPDSPLGELFKNFLGPEKAQPHHVTSLGTGFIIDPSGLIVTNNHVIEDADHITATLNDGTVLPAKLIGRDDKTDLALLKVGTKKPLPAAHFGDSDHARIGDWVIAIGNPFGLGSTVTAGIVSARNRNINAGPYDEFIQTDAPINRGNSGGPLFDMDGAVIGVNSQIYSPSGGSVGIGFSIPSNLVRSVIAQLRQFGVARRGWIGVRIQAVTDDLAEGLGVATRGGALITDVTAKGPAAKAGIENGDLVVAFDGKPVADSRALPRIVADTPIGKTVNVDVMRKGNRKTVRLTVAKLEDDKPMHAQSHPAAPAPAAKTRSRIAALGLSLAPIDQDARAQFKLSGGIQGVVVTDVSPDSAAWDKNLRPGDVIVQVQNRNVRTPEDVTRQIEADAKSGKKVELLLVNRGGDLTYVALKLG